MNKHATDDTVTGKLEQYPVLISVIQKRLNSYVRTTPVDAPKLLNHAYTRQESRFTDVNEIFIKFRPKQITADHLQLLAIIIHNDSKQGDEFLRC